jgi:peptidyl-prolyl cis-trans isomerase SDCCAG10
VQLASEGYYDDCPIHRVIKEFMIQTGDPSGTGSGGSSIWGKPFKDEIRRSRIRFDHHGTSRHGQREQAKHQPKPVLHHSYRPLPSGWISERTVFGKVTGNTIFECDQNGRSRSRRKRQTD